MIENARVFRGDRLKQLRLELGFTQDELNEILGLGTGNSINRYENGKSDPTADVLIRLANALNVSTDYLLGLVDGPEQHYHGIEDLSSLERRLVQAVRRGDPRPLLSILSMMIEETYQEGLAAKKN